MDNLRALIQWARDSDVVIRGIQPAEIPGHGTGIVAARALKAGEILVEAPPHTVRCLSTVSQSIRQKLPPDMPIHGLLAASLILEDGLPRPWHAILPSMPDLEAGMPSLWPEALRDLLPGDAQRVLNAQSANFRRQWSLVSGAFPDSMSLEEYRHAWLLVNSRSFLDCSPDTERYPWVDRLALVPVADLFNHSDRGARVHASDSGRYVVTADRAYSKGEEIFIVYGHHRNAFMLVEYGFIPDKNSNDDVYLDDVILPRLRGDQKIELERRGWLGDFPLSASAGEAQRTQAALHMLFCSPDEYTQFLRSPGDSTRRRCQDKLDAGMIDLLERFVEGTVVALERLEHLEVGSDAQKRMLHRHWRLMAMAAEERIKDLRGGSKGSNANSLKEESSADNGF